MDGRDVHREGLSGVGNGDGLIGVSLSTIVMESWSLHISYTHAVNYISIAKGL